MTAGLSIPVAVCRELMGVRYPRNVLGSRLRSAWVPKWHATAPGEAGKCCQQLSSQKTVNASHLRPYASAVPAVMSVQRIILAVVAPALVAPMVARIPTSAEARQRRPWSASSNVRRIMRPFANVARSLVACRARG